MGALPLIRRSRIDAQCARQRLLSHAFPHEAVEPKLAGAASETGATVSDTTRTSCYKAAVSFVV
jgi:hypothetical protein